MIKRRFYKADHCDGNDPSSDSSLSSSSDAEPEEADATEETEGMEETEDEDNKVVEPEAKDNIQDSSTSSGYESENGSADEIDGAQSVSVNEDDEIGNNRQIPALSQLSGKRGAKKLKKDFHGRDDEDAIQADMPDCVLKFKSVYKCRICPRIVCLTEETMRTHLNSKRHVRSEKLLKENRLKAVLNSNGEIENQETPAEVHARIVALVQDKLKKKNKGRQRQRKRSRKKNLGDDSNKERASQPANNPAKKSRKTEK